MLGFLSSSVFRGFGFVTYKTAEAVDKCLEMGPHVLDSKTVSNK